MIRFLLLLSTLYSTTLVAIDLRIGQKILTKDGREFVVLGLPENHKALQRSKNPLQVDSSQNRLDTINLILRDSATAQLHYVKVFSKWQTIPAQTALVNNLSLIHISEPTRP